MLTTVPLRVVELLAARLCHDLISPVSAIANGAELLGEEDPEFVREAATLIGRSAREANGRLQFFRFAFGFGGGGLAGPAPHLLADAYFAGAAVSCDYQEALCALPLPRQKLACALLLVAAEALPRGDRLVAGAVGGRPEIDAAGDVILLSPETRAALAQEIDPAELTTRTVTAYFAGLLAASQGGRLVLSLRPGGFRLSA